MIITDTMDIKLPENGKRRLLTALLLCYNGRESFGQREEWDEDAECGVAVPY
jgi:hypothetical protein